MKCIITRKVCMDCGSPYGECPVGRYRDSSCGERIDCRCRYYGVKRAGELEKEFRKNGKEFWY